MYYLMTKKEIFKPGPPASHSKALGGRRRQVEGATVAPKHPQQEDVSRDGKGGLLRPVKKPGSHVHDPFCCKCLKATRFETTIQAHRRGSTTVTFTGGF